MSRADKQKRVHDILIEYRDQYGAEDFKDFLVAVTKYVVGAPTNQPTTSTEEEATGAPPGEEANKGDTDKDFRRTTKQVKRPRREEAPQTVQTKNRYEVLTIENDNDEEDIHDTEMDDTIATDTPTTKKTLQGQNRQQTDIKTTKKITPIIIRDKQKWTEISRTMTDRNISFTKAKMVQSGIQVTPTTDMDYRQTYKLLKTQNVQFYTYTLTTDKTLKVVLRGLIQEITEDEVAADLTDKGFEVLKVIRMKGKTGPAPLVLVEVPREYNSIYKLTRCCNLTVKTETPNARPGIVQCHRCQLFGHVQKHCNSDYKCLKCGLGHSTHECTKPKTTQANCANCGQNHVSSSLECEKNPNRRNPLPVKETKRAWSDVTAQKPRKETNTEIPTPVKTPTISQESQGQNTETQLHTTLGEMLAAFAETNATDEQIRTFIKGTKNVIQLFRTKLHGR